MNSSMSGNMRVNDRLPQDLIEYSPPGRKRMRLDDDANCNLHNTLSNSSKARWSSPGDTSFVEPEILEDMGVSTLEDEEFSCENVEKAPLEACMGLSADVNDSRSSIYEDNPCDIQNTGIESSYGISSISRLEANGYERDAMYSTNANEAARGSKVINEEQHNNCRNDSSLSQDNFGLDTFCLHRKKRPSTLGEDKFNTLSDEMILMILKWLPKKCLVRCMSVCKRWSRIARDEVLWTRLDLGGKVLNAGTLGHILPRGVQILRLAQAEIAGPTFHINSEVHIDSYVSKLQYLDLSMAVISPSSLADLLSKCKYLKKLSLEKCTLTIVCCNSISENKQLEVLNLTMCEGMDIQCVELLTKLRSLTSLNVAWCNLDADSMALLCKSLPESITRINLSGCRKTMTDENIKELINCCPDIVELDLSDCTMLTISTVQHLTHLKKLEHLSLNRCYSIPPASYMKLASMPCLLYLDVFGLMTESILRQLQANSRGTDINKFLYSSIARPTVGVRRTSIWGLRVRD